MTDKQVKAIILKAFAEINRFSNEYQPEYELLDDFEEVVLGLITGDIYIFVNTEAEGSDEYE